MDGDTDIRLISLSCVSRPTPWPMVATFLSVLAINATALLAVVRLIAALRMIAGDFCVVVMLSLIHI